MRKNRDRTPDFLGGMSLFLFLQKIFKYGRGTLLCGKCVILCKKHGLSAEKLTSSGEVPRNITKHLEKIHKVLLAITRKVGYNYEHEDGAVRSG